MLALDVDDEHRIGQTFEGAETVDAVGAACGAGTDCGSCRDAIDELIEETLPSEVRSRSRLPMLMTG